MTNNIQNNSKTIQFLEAVRANNLTEVQAYLKDPEVNVNATDEIGHTELMSAITGSCRIEYLEIVQEILKHPTLKINQKDLTTRSTALHQAASWGRIDSVRLLLKMPKIDVNAKSLHGKTALEDALDAMGSDELVHLLFEDPRTVLNYKERLEWIVAYSDFSAGLIFSSYPTDAVTALLQHTRINKHTVNTKDGIELFEWLLQHDDDTLMRQAVVAGLDMQSNYDAYYAKTLAYYRNLTKAKELMHSLCEVQTNLTAAVQTLFRELGEEIDNKQAWVRLQNMPLSLTQLELFKKEACKTNLSAELINSRQTTIRSDILHVLLGWVQTSRLVTETLQAIELKRSKKYTFPAELVSKIIEMMEAEHLERLADFIQTRFKTDWLINPSDLQLSPNLSR